MADTETWQTEARALLARAASMCAEHGVDLDSFVQGAVSSYFAARPGLKEHIEQMQLMAQLEAMRQAGRVADA